MKFVLVELVDVELVDVKFADVEFEFDVVLIVELIIIDFFESV